MVVMKNLVATYLRKDLDRGRGGVELASTVVGDPDPVDALPYGLGRILRGHDALNHDLHTKKYTYKIR